MEMKNLKVTLGSAVTLIALFAVVFVLQGNFSGRFVSQGGQQIDLAINPFFNSALVFIAEEKGFFAEEGLKINYYKFPTGKMALDALIGGGADIATTADIPIALAGLAEQEISMIATIEYSNDNIPVIARKDSGIKSPEDLKGKNVATTRGGGPLFFTHRYFERHGIGLTDVNLVFMNPSDMVNSLVKGDIDAFIVFEPYPYYAENELGSDNVIIFNPTDLYGETWNIVTMKDYESRNPENVEKFLMALIKAEEFLKENPDESVMIVSRYSETDPVTLEEMMKRQKYGVSLEGFTAGLLRDEASWAIDMGFSKDRKIPDYSDVINPAHLQKLDPKKVNI